MNDTSISIQMGAEELLFLMGALGIQTLPGMGENPVEGLQEDQAKRALAAGYNSLRARGWVQENAGEAGQSGIDVTLVALLGTCATAKQVLFVSRQATGGADEVAYLHRGESLITIHHVKTPGVHEFVGVTTSADAVAWLRENVYPQSEFADGALPIRLQLPQANLDRATDAVRDGRLEEGKREMIAAGVSDGDADAFLAALKSVRGAILVALLHLNRDGQGEQSAPTEGFTLMWSSNSLWTLTPDREGKGNLDIMAVPVEVCLTRIGELLTQASRN